MKRKIVSLLFTAIVTTSCILSVPNAVYAADTVQSVTSINSDGKLIVDGTGVTIDSADIETMQQAINTNATILTDVQDLAEQNETNIAQTSDEYSSSKTYKKGQLCIKDGSLYKCKVDINTAEAWTSSHWTKTSLASVSGNLSSEVSDLNDSLNMFNSALIDNLSNTGHVFRYAEDGEGNGGYLKADGSFVPFKSGASSLNKIHEDWTSTHTSCSVEDGHIYLVCCILDGNSYDLSVVSGGEVMSRNTWVWYNDRSTQLLLKATKSTLVLQTNHNSKIAVFELM